MDAESTAGPDPDLDPEPDDEVETQWTGPARDRYAAASQDLLDAVGAHAALVAGREGRQAELGPYFASVEHLQQVMDEFRDAELDLSGSVPFPPLTWEDDDEDEDPEDDGREPGPLLSVEHRVSIEVLDEDRLVEAGRAAYLEVWPEDTAEDARLAVGSPAQAVGTLIHAQGLGVLDANADYLRQRYTELSITQEGIDPPDV